MKNCFKNRGPATLIAAAFIGPGTVTLCTIAGVNFGFDLLWAMLLSIFATIILQEMSARLGIISQKGLSEVIKQEIKNWSANWWSKNFEWFNTRVFWGYSWSEHKLQTK